MSGPCRNRPDKMDVAALPNLRGHSNLRYHTHMHNATELHYIYPKAILLEPFGGIRVDLI